MTAYRSLTLTRMVARLIIAAFFVAAMVACHILIPVTPGFEMLRIVGMSVYGFLAVVYLVMYSCVERYDEKGQVAAATQTVT